MADLISPEAHVSYQRLPWNAVLPLKPPLHTSVSEIYRFAEHERTAANDAVDAVRGALSNGFLGHAAVSKRPMEPDLADAVVTALSHDLRRDIRRGGDDHAVQLSGNTTDFAVARGALDC